MKKVKLVDLSHLFGRNAPLWPYFPHSEIEGKDLLDRIGAFALDV